jgi:hypothetical protein
MDASKWKLLFIDWLQGVMKASTRMIGNRQVKTMFRGMSLVYVNILTRRIEEETGEDLMLSCSSLKEAAEKIKQLELKADLASHDDVKVNKVNSDGIEVIYHNCIYGDFCNEALGQLLSTGEFNEKSIPCLRLSNYCAAATQFANIRVPYHLIQFAPGAICKGLIQI